MLIKRVVTAATACALAVPFIAYAADLNPASCDELFQMARGTIEMSADKKIMNEEVCGAYAFLITRYDIGSRSAPCIRTKSQGILGLNPDFAVALANMLKKAPYMRINSALRPPACQGGKNPNSNHTVGCAVDLGYNQNNCSSQECQWVLRYAPSAGLRIRMPYAPEWNHVEPANVQQCRAQGPGGGVVPSRIPFDNNVRGLVNTPTQTGTPTGRQEQYCSLPDGAVVPCSSIRNGNVAGAPAQTGAPAGAPASQPLPAAQQPFQNLPTPTPVSSLVTPSNPIPAPVGATTTGTSTRSTSTGTSTGRKLSAFEQISAIGSPTQAGVAATSAPLLLVVRERDSAKLEGTDETRPEQSVPPADDTYRYAFQNQQGTFVSNDLYGGAPPAAEFQPQNQLQRVLLDFRNFLSNVLRYMQPFRGLPPGTVPPGAPVSEAD